MTDLSPPFCSGCGRFLRPEEIADVRLHGHPGVSNVDGTAFGLKPAESSPYPHAGPPQEVPVLPPRGHLLTFQEVADIGRKKHPIASSFFFWVNQVIAAFWLFVVGYVALLNFPRPGSLLLFGLLGFQLFLYIGAAVTFLYVRWKNVKP